MINPGNYDETHECKEHIYKQSSKVCKVLAGGIFFRVEEGTVFEITVTKPGEEPITTNFKVLQSDLELMESLKDLQ